MPDRETDTTPSKEIADALFEAASIAFAAGRLGEARQGFEALLEHSPNRSDALLELGKVCLDLDHPAEALKIFQRGIRAAPKNAQIWHHLALALNRLDQLPTALRCVERAVELSDETPEISLSRCGLLLASGNTVEAEGGYRSLYRRHPDNADAAAGLASVLERTGRHREAWDLLAREWKNLSPNVIIRLASLSRAMGRPEDGISVAQRALAQLTSPPIRRSILTELGHCAHALERHETAFHAYSEANQISRSTFDLGALQRGNRRQVRAYSRDLPKRPTTTPPVASFVPVFIVGMPRSGTSLTHQLLDMHSQVQGCGESKSMIRLSTQLLEGSIPEMPSYPDDIAAYSEDQLDFLARQYVSGLETEPSTRGFRLDKMPHNFAHLGLISRLFPSAKLVHCVRDPLDTTWSCYRQLFARGHTWTNSQERLIAFYRCYRTLMLHWIENLSLEIYTLHYETLVDAPDAEVPALLEYLGLSFEEACLHPESNPRPMQTLSNQQVRKAMHGGSVHGSRQYVEWLQPLTEGLEEIRRELPWPWETHAHDGAPT